ncbi:MAG: SAP domain-containing protein [Cardiobacteriaceae bacterium]|nr:SAP domain-containing protein [Cardiobacteriaceae bacterium]
MNTHTDFAPERRFYEQAYQQIIVDGKIAFPRGAQQAKTLLLRDLRHGDTDKTTKALMEKMQAQDFAWPLHQRCVQLCLEHEIYPGAFHYLALRPHSPETLPEALTLLTVPEIKAVLKAHGQPVTGKRADLERQAQEVLRLEDLRSNYTEKLAQQQEKFNQMALKEKYHALVSMVDMRAHFLRRVEQLQELLQGEVFKHALLPIEAEPDDAKLAALLDGSGYVDAVTESTIHKLLPLFPGGEQEIYTRRLRRESAPERRPQRQPWWKKLRLWK